MNAARIVRRLPLKTLLSLHSQPSQQRKPYLSMSAKQRYGIAAEAAWSVLYISGSPWLRGQWDEEQASIFLEERAKGLETLSQNTCLSCIIYEPKIPVQGQQEQHQKLQAANDLGYLIVNKSIFALGIFLVELCLNKSITDIRKDIGRTDVIPDTPSLLYDYYTAERSLDMVRAEAGDPYGDAVERCVKFVFPGRAFTKHFDSPSFQQDFYNTVVAPIQATYLQFPDSRTAVC